MRKICEFTTHPIHPIQQPLYHLYPSPSHQIQLVAHHLTLDLKTHQARITETEELHFLRATRRAAVRGGRCLRLQQSQALGGCVVAMLGEDGLLQMFAVFHAGQIQLLDLVEQW